VARLVDLHDSVASPHLQRLLDVGVEQDGYTALVFERSELGLADLLRTRGELRPGEIVTVLASVAAALEHIHRSGFACGSFGVRNVGFAPDGRPFLTRLVDVERAYDRTAPPWVRRPTDPGRPLSDAEKDDYRSFAALCRTLLAPVVDAENGEVTGTGPGYGRELARVDEWILRATEKENVESMAEAVEFRIFAIADAEAVAFEPDWPQDCSDLHVSEAALRPRDAALTRRAARAAMRESADDIVQRIAWLLPSRLEALAAPALRALVKRTRPAGETTQPDPRTPRRFDRPTRRRIRGPILVAGALAVLVVALGMMLPGSGGEAAEGAPANPPPAAAGGDGPPRADDGPRDQDHPRQPDEPDHADAVAQEDPVPAVSTLLEQRRRCIEARSVECLDTVDEPGSALLAADAHSIEANAVTGDVLGGPAEAATVTLVARHGDAAILQIGSPDGQRSEVTEKPAVVLAMKTTAGWRLRDLFEST